MKINFKIEAVSIQSMIVGSVIMGVIAAAGVSGMWGSVDKAKTTIVGSHIKQISSSISSVKKEIEDVNGDLDYLDDLKLIGAVEDVPWTAFGNPSTVKYEIHKIENDTNSMFVLVMDSNNSQDKDIMNSAINKMNFSFSEQN